MQKLDVEIYATSEQAANAGYVYREPAYKGLMLEKAVIVRKGTEEGNPTVDLILVDADGNKFVAMPTGRILKTLATLIGDVK